MLSEALVFLEILNNPEQKDQNEKVYAMNTANTVTINTRQIIFCYLMYLSLHIHISARLGPARPGPAMP